MKISLSWLRTYLKTDAHVNVLAERLTKNGLVVAKIEDLGKILKGFKVVEVREASPHPKADRLKVCRVWTGKEELQVVCGGPNARTGMKTVLAGQGMIIPKNGMVMKKTIIRDVESCGMLCSEEELNLSDDATGFILDLPLDAGVGQDYVDYLGMSDPVLDIEITPNRGDCLSAHGLARDLGATEVGTWLPFTRPQIENKWHSTQQLVLEKQEDCPYFSGRIIRGLKNKKSPLWLQQKLRSVGLRSISAIVDITNYVLMDLGQPMHAFDLNKLRGHLCIRAAQPGEKIETLDGKEYPLNSKILVVADEEGPCSIAGIMGGSASACDEATTDIFLESAYFHNTRISEAGQSLNIHSDSRFRFDRGVDPQMILPALDYATQMILEICGGEASQIIEVGHLPMQEHNIAFQAEKVENLGGLKVSQDEAAQILRALGFECSEGHVRVPTWRHDIDGEADLVEEILRIKGYDAIPTEPLPVHIRSQTSFQTNPYYQRLWSSRRVLGGQGYQEVLTWSFLKKERAKLFGFKNEDLELENPISQDLGVMRPSLIPNLLDMAKKNIERSTFNPMLFEVGSQYEGTSQQDQHVMVSGIRTGYMNPRHWAQELSFAGVFDVKADVLAVLRGWNIDTNKIQVMEGTPPWYHPTRSGCVQLGPKNIFAYFGDLHPRLQQDFGFKDTVCLFEIFLSRAPLSSVKAQRKSISLSPYPPVERDFAFLIDRSVSAAAVVAAVKKTDSSLIQEVAIFDVYEGKGIPEDKKSIALSVRLGSLKATLTEDDIKQISDGIVHNVYQATGGILRV